MTNYLAAIDLDDAESWPNVIKKTVEMAMQRPPVFLPDVLENH